MTGRWFTWVGPHQETKTRYVLKAHWVTYGSGLPLCRQYGLQIPTLTRWPCAFVADVDRPKCKRCLSKLAIDGETRALDLKGESA